MRNESQWMRNPDLQLGEWVGSRIHSEPGTVPVTSPASRYLYHEPDREDSLYRCVHVFSAKWLIDRNDPVGAGFVIR